MSRILKLHNLLQKRELSSRELTARYLDAIKRDNSALGAYVNVTEEQALCAADKADKRIKEQERINILEGIPMALKDNISTRGIDTTCCSKMLLGYKPLYDATAYAKLLSKGAVLLGKTNMDEFGMGSSCEHSCFGKARNPHDSSKSTGGSSGGSAAAVAGGLAPYALGSDTGGSVRQPASFCGIVGLKPTYSAVSRYGLVAFASSLDQIGPMATCVEDVSVVFDATAGFDPLDSTTSKIFKADAAAKLKDDIKGKTLAVVKEFFESVSEDVKASVEKAISTFEAMGAKIVYCSMPELSYALPAYYILACAEASSNLARYDGVRFGNRTNMAYDSIADMMCKSRSEFLGDEVKRRIMMGSFVLSRGFYDAYYKKAQLYRQNVKTAFDKIFEKCDALITPTAPTTAFSIDRVTHSAVEDYQSDVCTVSVNIASLPAVSLCCGYGKDNMPVGMQIIGNRFCEDTILNLAYMFEQNTDFNKQTDWGVKL